MTFGSLYRTKDSVGEPKAHKAKANCGQESGEPKVNKAKANCAHKDRTKNQNKTNQNKTKSKEVYFK